MNSPIYIGLFLFFLVSTLVSSFQELHNPQQTRVSFEKASLHPPTPLHVSTSSTEKSITRNIFHDYDKPIVLLGCSSEGGNELSRLAQSILSKIKCDNSCKAIQLAANKDDNFLQMIESNTLGWPNVLVLDLGDSFDGTPGDSESHYIEMAERLYNDNGLLSVYVNVDSSVLTEESRSRKSQVEKNMFVKYSDYELCIKDEGVTTESSSNWEHIEWELFRLLARARLAPAIPGDKKQSVNCAHLTMGLHTFFLSLSFPDIRQVEPYVEEMCKDVDAMEYRVDLLDCRDDRFEVLYGMQLLRKYCRPYAVRVPALPFCDTVIEDTMPIVYTVRTANQAGRYPDNEEGISNMFDLLELGLRAGIEILDVESTWDSYKTSNLLQKAEERYSSQILGSNHIVGKTIDIEESVEIFENCSLNGRAHGAKVVLSIDSDTNDRMAYEAALIASELAEIDGEPVIPNIGLILGEVGQYSRVINFPFTPVTHESLPFKAAPGQLTANEIMTTRLLTGLFSRKKYCILGHNIAYSVSPQMQGAAFAAAKLPHEFSRFDVESVEEFITSDFFKSDEFGGASVTIPHKQAIIKAVDVLSEAAERIGSVNTLNVKDEFVGDGFRRVIHGDNTDWRGMYNPLKRIFGGSIKMNSDFALIVGAGGTARAAAYVATKLGLKCLYYNRTPAKAVELSESFGGVVLDSLDLTSSEGNALGNFVGDGGVGSLRLVISTLPAASNFVLPDWLLGPEFRNLVIFDVNYKPFHTSLLRQAESAGLSVVRGSEMLWEQGVGQFEIWMERTAPYRVMKEIVLLNCEE